MKYRVQNKSVDVTFKTNNNANTNMNGHSHCKSKLSEWPGNVCVGEVLTKPPMQLMVRYLSKCAGNHEHTRASERAAFEQGSHTDQPMDGYQPLHAQATRRDLLTARGNRTTNHSIFEGGPWSPLILQCYYQSKRAKFGI